MLLRLADKTTVANATPVPAAQIFMRNPGFASAPVRKGIDGPQTSQRLRAERERCVVLDIRLNPRALNPAENPPAPLARGRYRGPAMAGVTEGARSPDH